MTNNTTAPERIWANHKIETAGSWWNFNAASTTEYVRADALEAAQARIAELERALGYYADEENWRAKRKPPANLMMPPSVVMDRGGRARAALQEGKG